MTRLSRIHLFIGIVGIIVFVLTGQYMHWAHDHLRGMADGPRLLYRTSHIYLLWSSLLNLVVGVSDLSTEERLVRVSQFGASTLVLAGPALFLFSFFKESNTGMLSRPVTRVGIYAALAGVLLHTFARLVATSRHTEDEITTTGERRADAR
jgi:hypothetical protein